MGEFGGEVFACVEIFEYGGDGGEGDVWEGDFGRICFRVGGGEGGGKVGGAEEEGAVGGEDGVGWGVGGADGEVYYGGFEVAVRWETGIG